MPAGIYPPRFAANPKACFLFLVFFRHKNIAQPREQRTRFPVELPRKIKPELNAYDIRTACLISKGSVGPQAHAMTRNCSIIFCQTFAEALLGSFYITALHHMRLGHSESQHSKLDKQMCLLIGLKGMMC